MTGKNVTTSGSAEVANFVERLRSLPAPATALSELITKVLNESGPQRRWPRKQPIKGLVFHVARRSAKVIDISYGGIRLELPPAETILAKFRMAIPGFEGVFRAKPVWSRYTPQGAISCGAERCR